MRMVTGAMMSLMLLFMTTFSALARGLAIVMMVTLLIVSVITPVVICFTEVISVFLNIFPVMMVSLIYGSIVQTMTENIFKVNCLHFKNTCVLTRQLIWSALLRLTVNGTASFFTLTVLS